MKHHLRISIVSALISIGVLAILADPNTDHMPRDHDRLHPGLANTRRLVLSVIDSTRTVMLDPEAASFDDARDASVYIDGDTISYVQFATKHRFILRSDTLSYIGYENRGADFRHTTEISGPGFTQCLYYTDGPGKKLYNGSVSAMTWTMGTDATVRGYRYTYNPYGWLTAAEYGEGTSLTDRKDRYTEKSLEFMLNGGIRRLQRHGLKADGNYGKVDNLHIYYDGNRITGVLDDALPVTQNGSMDFPVSGKEMAMEYNGWGALVKDESRKITNISYDRFGNPLRISYSNGAYTEYVYSATGEKLRMTHGTSLNAASTGMEPYGDMESAEDTASEPMAAASSATSVTEYHGNVIYRDGKVDMVLFPGGYATINGTSVTFHYYTQDYLGNNRAVINGSTGAVEQTVAYYPYGAVIADLGNPTGGQPFRFGGKELFTANGLNEYDFGARWYLPIIPGFTRPDNMAEKYSWLSPYLYCANNPVNAFDPDGNIIIFVNGMHFGDGGSAKYWGGVDNTIQHLFQDHKAMYIDGSHGGCINTIFGSSVFTNNLSAGNRKQLGYILGNANAQIIYQNLQNNETIKIITHSMGGATAKGFIQALIDYVLANLNEKEPRIVLELDLAPFEWWLQEGNPKVETHVISHWNDKIAWPAKMHNAQNHITRFWKNSINPIAEHAIKSFSQDIKELIRKGDIPLYIDDVKQN